MTKKPSKASVNVYNALRDNPEEIIKWCEQEILEYQNLIKLIKKGKQLVNSSVLVTGKVPAREG